MGRYKWTEVVGTAILTAILCLTTAKAAILVTCTSSNKCSISVYKSSDPQDFSQHTIELVPLTDSEGKPVPIPETNETTFIYDGETFTTTCDGTWHPFGTPAGIETQNQIACTVDRSGDIAPGTQVYATLKVYDQTVYDNPYAECPGYTIDPQLKDTSESYPYCVTDDSLAPAEACKWEEQNLDDPLLNQKNVPLNYWVVYGKTEVTDLPLSYAATTENFPFEDGDQVCFADINNDGDLSEDEIAECISTPQGYLCPLEAVRCVGTYSDPICPDGGSLNPNTDKCETNPSWECSLDSSTYSNQTSCETSCQQSGTCSASTTYTCPSGYTLQGSTCVATPTCGCGAQFSPSLHACTGGTSTPYCQYGGVIRNCYCYISTNSCPPGYWSTGSGCEGNVNCTCGGYWNCSEYGGFCVFRPFTPSCPSGGSFNASTNRCEATPSSSTRYRCSLTGSYYSTLSACQSACTQTGSCSSSCPSGYTNSGGLCIANPTCSGAGTYDPDQDKCYEGDTTCPYGSEYQCMEHDGIAECSPHSCDEFQNYDLEEDDTEQGANDKFDDGTYDQDGNCLGTIYIFNGHDKRCRNAGVLTGFHNCCRGGEFWFGLAQCSGEEEQLAKMRDKGLCHYVGSYCAKRVKFIGCIQRKRTYCCYSSKLGRILQEQGRPLLQSFGPDGGWGEPKNPNCRGFTAQEFQNLDFDRIDLSEWYGDIQVQTQSAINASMQQKITNFYNNIQ